MKLKKLTALLLTIALGVAALTSCSSSGDESSSDGENLTYVSLRTNPEIELIADEDGIIEKVMPKVKPDTNASEILDYLRASQTNK